MNKLEITTDKRLLAAAGNPQIRLFEVASGNNQAVLTYEGHSSNVTAVSEFSWQQKGTSALTVSHNSSDACKIHC